MMKMKENRVQIYSDINIDIKLIGYLECLEDWVGTVHVHNFWEIIIQTEDLKAFEFMVCPPNEMHEFRKFRENTVSHLVYIGFNFKHDENLHTEEVKADILYLLRKKNNREFYLLFYEKMMNNTETSRDNAFLATITIFLINLLSKYLFGKSEGSSDNKIVSEVKALIDNNMNRLFTIDMIASSLYISPKYLGEIFRRNTGEGILQYQKRKKMELAVLLLRSGVPIKVVHQRLGYDNVQYFSNSFKSYYGISPVNFYNRGD